MTVHAILVDPPRSGQVLQPLVEMSPLSADEVAELYGAMVRDVVLASVESGGDTLVNYRPIDDSAGDEFVEADVTELVADAVEDPGEVRYEVQVGSTHAARAGNTATHLLDEEDADGVAIIDPRAPMLSRRVLDGAAMKLRSSDLVIGPGPGGRAPYLGLTVAIDFSDAYNVPEIETLATRGGENDLSVDFIETLPVVETDETLATLVATIQARRAADRWVPPFTTATLETLGLSVVRDGQSRTVEKS